MLDLYVCLRPVQYFKGVPSPVKRPEKVDMVIFRENTEDIYAGIEYAGGSPEAQKMFDFIAEGIPESLREDSLSVRKEKQGFLAGSGRTGFPERRPRRHRHQTGSYSGTIRLIQARSVTRSRTNARASPSCTRATS